jgi:hypothetical protein
MMVIRHAASPDLDRRIEWLSRESRGDCRRAARVRFAARHAGHGCGLPTVEDGFRVCRTIDQRDFVEDQASDNFGITGLALRDPATYRKAAIDLVSDLSDRNRVHDMGNNPGRPVVTDFGLQRRSGSR